MRIRGLHTVATKRIEWLQNTFNLSVEEAKALKKGKEIEVKSADADALLQQGLVSASVQKTKQRKPKSPVNDDLGSTNTIAPDMGEEV